MSHIPRRKEKDCLNCGTMVQGKYCHECGQENVVPHETFWHMVKHFLYDITHFDSKFFDSMKFLLFKPGFLPGEYVRGRQSIFIHEIVQQAGIPEDLSQIHFTQYCGHFGDDDPVSFIPFPGRIPNLT